MEAIAIYGNTEKRSAFSHFSRTSAYLEVVVEKLRASLPLRSFRASSKGSRVCCLHRRNSLTRPRTPRASSCFGRDRGMCAGETVGGNTVGTVGRRHVLVLLSTSSLLQLLLLTKLLQQY